MSVRPVAPSDIAVALELVRLAVGERALPLTVYAYPGAERVVREIVSGIRAEEAMLGEYRDDVLVGVAHVRRLDPDMCFVNNIAVLPEQRGAGAGLRLLAGACAWGAARGLASVGLDVFTHRERASRWYRSLGFTLRQRSAWTAHGLRFASWPADALAVGLDDADRAQRADGFSSFSLRTPRAEHSVTRLGDGYFRSLGRGLLDDAVALDALGALDATRTLVCLGPVDGRDGGDVLLESDRLGVPLSELARVLSEKGAADRA